MLALSFYHSQDSAVRDISRYESLEDRAANEALPPGAPHLDFIKQNITKQVLQLAVPDEAATCHQLLQYHAISIVVLHLQVTVV